MKITILTFSLLLSLTAHGQINVKDSLQTVLKNDTVDALTRFFRATHLITRNSSPEEADVLCQTVVYPFVQEAWESQSDRLARLAQLHLAVGICHRERGGDDRHEQERNSFVKAVEAAKASGNDAIHAHCLTGFGFMECKRGDLKQGNEYFYRAIELYDKLEMYDSATEMLYVIGLNFRQIKDAEGLQRVVAQMYPYLKKDKSKQTLYQYNTSKKICLDMLLEKTKNEGKPIDEQLVDTIISVIRANIGLVENFRDELSRNWQHGWSYYNLSKAFYDYYPDQTDTVFHYLDKASELVEKDLYIRNLEAYAEMEIKIYIHQLQAQTLSRQGKLQEAYRTMSQSLGLLNKLSGYQTLDEQRYTAYQFMADYYEQTDNPAEALTYQKYLRESEAGRYESEKIQAINDMLVKYETEKKEIQIQTLAKENKTARRILWLTVALSLALLTISLFIILSNRLKRKNAEQQLYETALLAELRQNELEKVQSAKQQLEQNPVKSVIENIVQAISLSMIEKDSKKVYLERLSKIDGKALENAYQTSKVKITGMDVKYIICFTADMDVKDISLLFNIEPKSVHTVRYRIRKKFAKDDIFQMIL